MPIVVQFTSRNTLQHYIYKENMFKG